MSMMAAAAAVSSRKLETPSRTLSRASVCLADLTDISADLSCPWHVPNWLASSSNAHDYSYYKHTMMMIPYCKRTTLQNVLEKYLRMEYALTRHMWHHHSQEDRYIGRGHRNCLTSR